MEPLIVLTSVFVISILLLRILKQKWLAPPAGRIAMAAMLLFTAIGHFLYPAGMALMLPGFIPFKTETIYATGVFEIAGAAGLLIPKFQKLTAWLLIVFFILILPANIHAALHHVNLKTAGYDGQGPAYLWFRIPLQLLFILWVYYSGVKPASV